jgi:hypothetical protein
MNEQHKSIEEIIKSNRDRFDYHVPPKMVWEEIEKKLPEKTKKFQLISFWPKLGIAASFLLIGMFGASMFLNNSPKDPQIENIDKYYKNQFNVSYELLSESNSIPDELEKELKELEEIEIELKEEIQKNYGDTRDLMIKRLIDHYKTKIRLIELITDKKENINKNNVDI